MKTSEERNYRGAGKGDRRRPTREQIYRENYDQINWLKQRPFKEILTEIEKKDRAIDNKPAKGPGSCPEFF